MMRMRRASCALLTLALACAEGEPRAQWTVVLSTDAPLPDFGSLLLVELLAGDTPDAPSPARRLIDVANPSVWPISFGVAPGRAGPPRLRARLYRADQVGVRGEPEGSAFIDVTARLPPLSGATRVQLRLPMACFGFPPDLTARTSCDPETALVGPEPVLREATSDAIPLKVGSWPPGNTRPCVGSAPPGMVCVPGGAFILGTVRLNGDPFQVDSYVEPPRIVQIRPFALDVDEVSVAQVRPLIMSGALSEPKPPADAELCSYRSLNDASRDAYPMNCVAWAEAERICELLGKRLPSEAEWDYAAGNLGEKTPFPWGDDLNICDHAIVARGGGAYACLYGSRVAAGPVPGGHPRDLTRLGLRNLAGNVAEWTSDFSQPYTSACWSSARVLSDPHCSAGDVSDAAHSYRGGASGSEAGEARLGQRYHNDSDQAHELIGFRCALSLSDPVPAP